MRIICGTAAGRLLKAPKGLGVRPTPDLVRQAVFNSLGGRVVGAKVLDLFSGTGALGLECFSRGAASIVSVEKSGKHAGFIQRNWQAAGFPRGALELRTQDVHAVVAQFAAEKRRFDLILADPPYGDKNVGRRSTSMAQKLLDDPWLPALLAPDGLFVLGHTKRDTLTVVPPWQEAKVLRHGDSTMSFLLRAAAPDTAPPEPASETAVAPASLPDPLPDEHHESAGAA